VTRSETRADVDATSALDMLVHAESDRHGHGRLDDTLLEAASAYFTKLDGHLPGIGSWRCFRFPRQSA
jgi:hypothetical protein